jgi:hypothetical protein
MLSEAQLAQWQSPLHTDVIGRDLFSGDQPLSIEQKRAVTSEVNIKPGTVA